MAGCLNALTGREPVEFEAEPAAVSDATLDATGYTHADTDPIVHERTVSTPIGDRDVVVRNWAAEYHRALELGSLGTAQMAVFTVLTTPQVSLPGREFNPVADMSSRDLAEEVQSEYDELDAVEHVVDETVELLGSPTTIGVFDAEAVVTGGVRIGVDLRISDPVSVDDDYLVVVGVYPSIIPDEDETVRELTRGVEYDGR